MGASVSTEAKALREHSMAIDKQIEEDSMRRRKQRTILLLGSKKSGKSTIMRQLKILYQNGYTMDELAGFRLSVYKNLVDSAKEIVLAVEMAGLDWVEDINRTHAVEVLECEVDSDPPFRLSAAIALAIGSIMQDPIIATLKDRSSGFKLRDSALYFVSEARRMTYSDYHPNESDVLRIEANTSGISESWFILPGGQLSIHVLDLGTQRSQRRKWMHCFAEVYCIIFCVALSEYNETLTEDQGQNKLANSFLLFESIVNCRWFLGKSVTLFLNKIDVFKAKLPKAPLEQYFPEYTGGPDINKAAKYILWRFMQANRARLSVYPHLTQATDTSNIRLVFAAVKETILQNYMQSVTCV